MYNWALSPGAVAGDVWFIRDFQPNAQLVLLHNGQPTALPLGPLPPLSQPTGAAVSAGGALWIVGSARVQSDTTGYLVQLNTTTGQPVGRPVNFTGATGSATLAADGKGSLYLPSMGEGKGSVSIYNPTQQQWRVVELVQDKRQVMPTSVAPVANGSSAYVVDSTQPGQVGRFDLQTGQFLSAYITGRQALPSALAVDLVDDSVWAATTGTILHWSVSGALLSNWTIPDSRQYSQRYNSLAVDRTHNALLTTCTLADNSGVVLNSTIQWVNMKDATVLGTFVFNQGEAVEFVTINSEATRVYAVTQGGVWVYAFDQTTPAGTGQSPSESLGSPAFHTVTASSPATDYQ